VHAITAEQALRDGDARAAYRAMQRAEAGGCAIDGCGNVLLVRDVRGDEKRLGAQLLSDAFARFAINIRDNNSGSGVRKALCCRGAET
jgi:hypothetical protein